MRPWGGPSREWRDDNIGHFPPNLVLMSWNQHNFLKAWWRDDSRAMSWYHKDFYIHGVIRTPLEGPQISRQDQMYRWNPTRGNPQNILIKWANSPFLVIFKLSNVVGALRVLRSWCSQSLKNQNSSQKFIMLSIFSKSKKNSLIFLWIFSVLQIQWDYCTALFTVFLCSGLRFLLISISIIFKTLIITDALATWFCLIGIT